MNKSDVYSWRVSRSTKVALQDEARRAGKSLGALLDNIAVEWLRARREATADEGEEQARLHASVSRALGSIAGGDPHRAERARSIVRQRVMRRRAR